MREETLIFQAGATYGGRKLDGEFSISLRRGDLALLTYRSGEREYPMFGVVSGVDSYRSTPGGILKLDPSFGLRPPIKMGRVEIPSLMTSHGSRYRASHIDSLVSGDADCIASALRAGWKDLEAYARLIEQMKRPYVTG